MTDQMTLNDSINDLKNFEGAAVDKLDLIAAALSVLNETGTRKDTAIFFTVREKGSRSRQKCNEDALAIIAKYANEVNPKLSGDEKATLAKFSGYGGGLIDPKTGQKGSAYEYYTPKPIAEGIWDVMADLGFKGGRMLDPCSGTGIFGATAPENCIVDAVELSEQSGRVNQLVNGGAGYRCKIAPFEKVASQTEDEVYDAVVTNVPFGDNAARGGNQFLDSRYRDEPLEGYFILRSLEKLKPNGMAAFIVPTRCLDEKGGKQESIRKNASLMAEFIGAYRLPTGTFSSADTDTVTDVIFFKKYSREVAEKISELREQKPDVLSEANVLFSDFIDGRWFVSEEGKRYVLGTFEAKDPTKFRDVDKVLNNASVFELRDILREKKLPKSRVNWDLLSATPTEPIEYNEGDHIIQGGATYEFQSGRWVLIQTGSDFEKYAPVLGNIQTPYGAFANHVSYQNVDDLISACSIRDRMDDLPAWLMPVYRSVERVGEAKWADAWQRAVIALSVEEVMNDHTGQIGFNYFENFKELSEAMAKAKLNKSEARTIGGKVRIAMQTAMLCYSKAKGYSDFWLGNVQQEAKKSEEIANFAQTTTAKIERLRYETKSPWFDIAKVKEIMGENFDPLKEAADWCVSGDGQKVIRTEDYYTGNYAEFLERIDAEIAAADGELKDRLIRQKADANTHLVRKDPYKIAFTMKSPLIRAEELQRFIEEQVCPFTTIQTRDSGTRFVDINSPFDDDMSKLYNRIGDYLKNGTITLGNLKFKSMSNEQALAELRRMVHELNAQFDTWVKGSETIMRRLEHKMNDPKNLRFVDTESAEDLAVPGIKPNLKLHDYQSAYVRKLGRDFSGICAFGVGLGKAQPLDAKILTPNGWVTMGTIKVGDQVIGRDGLPTTVTAIYPQGKKEIFEVVFSDGSKTKCCNEHLWLTQTENDRKKMAYHRSRGREIYIAGTPKLLSEIRESLIYGKHQKNHKIPMVMPVQFERREYKCDPYLLGVVLGDGGLTAGFASLTNSSEEVVSRVRELLARDFPDVQLKNYTEKTNEYRIAKIHADSGLNSFVQEMKRLGLQGCRSENKFVPPEYMFGSIEQRLDLLHGLMDTDGYVSKDGMAVQFSSSSRRLAEAVKELVQSLGGIAWIKVKKTPCLDSHMVSIRMPSQFNAFSLKRKAERAIPRSKYIPVRYIVSVTSVGEEDAQCIQVDSPEHLYVTDEYIVTHNTFTALSAVQHAQAIGAKKKTLIVVPNSVFAGWRKSSGRAFTSTDDCLYVGLRKGRGGRMVVKSSAYDEDLALIRENKYSKIFMTQEAFQRLRVKEETIQGFIDYMSHEDTAFQAKESKADDEKKNSKLSAFAQGLATTKGAAPYIEELGIDSIVIDEAHFYKNAAWTQDFRSVKYLSLGKPSDKGKDALVKTWYIRCQNKHNDGILMLTATPITNSPLEMYSMLALAVGVDRVNSVMGGMMGADDFMEMCCEKGDETYKTLTGDDKNETVFIGLQNVPTLSEALHTVIDFKDAKDVGAVVKIPEREEKKTEVVLDQATLDIIEKRQHAYQYAKGNPPEVKQDPDYRRDYEEVLADIGAVDPNVLKSPFNFIKAMDDLIVDKDLDRRATIYTVAPEDVELAKKVIADFAAKKITEKRDRPSRYAAEEDMKEIVNKQTIVNDDGSEIEKGSTSYEIKIKAYLEGTEIILDTLAFNTQNVFEKIADAAGLKLNVSISPKFAAMLENFKDEMAHPRGLAKDADGNVVTSKIVKQIVFCDKIPLHAKLRRLISQHCGVPASKIAIITGQTNNEPEQLQAVQDGFNADGEDNQYQCIIANEKAEVGINLQHGTQAIHHLTIGWTPDSIEQRNGRGARQGNQTEKVTIYFYDAAGSFDTVRRSVVSKKDDWITEVTSKDNTALNVKISGGLSNDDYDDMIQTMGDADALDRLQKNQAERERQNRIKATREKQNVNLNMYMRQNDVLKANEKFELFYMREAWKLVELRKTVAENKAKIALKDGSNMGDRAKKNFEKLKADTQLLENQLREGIKRLAEVTNPTETQPAELVVADRVFDFADGFRKAPSWLPGGVTLKEDSGIAMYDDWQRLVKQAESIKKAAKENFRAASSDDGAVPASVIDAVDEGRVFRLPGGRYIVHGTFAYDKDDFCLSIVENGEFSFVRAYRYATGSDELLKGGGSLNEKYPDHLARLLSFAESGVKPGESGYTNMLRKAAELDDEYAAQGSVGSIFTEHIPAVGQFRNTVDTIEYEWNTVKLPAPYFPAFLGINGESSELVKKLANEQRTLVKVSSKSTYSYPKFLAPANQEFEAHEWTNEERDDLLIQYAIDHGEKIAPKDIMTYGKYMSRVAEVVNESLDIEKMLEACPNAPDYDNAYGELARYFLSLVPWAETLPYNWFDRLFVWSTIADIKKAFSDRAKANQPADQAKDKPVKPSVFDQAPETDGCFYIGGDTRSHYNRIKWTCSSARWMGRRAGVWRISESDLAKVEKESVLAKAFEDGDLHFCDRYGSKVKRDRKMADDMTDAMETLAEQNFSGYREV